MDARQLTTNMQLPPPIGHNGALMSCTSVYAQKKTKAFFKLDGMEVSPGRKPCTYTNQ